MEKFYSTLLLFCFYFGTAQFRIADSLFFVQNYQAAKQVYLKEKIDTNAIVLNRLGYCYHKTKNFMDAIDCYLKAEKLSKNPLLSFTIESRLAKVYSVIDQKEISLRWLKKAVANGYSNLTELNEDPDFANLRKHNEFSVLYDSLYTVTFPCKKEVKRRQFDYWLGNWDVFSTNGNIPNGTSVIENVSEGCVILENYSGPGGYCGKSMNYINEKGEWEQTWMGSDGNVTRFYSGKFDGNEMLFVFEKTDKLGKKKIGKFHFYKIGNNTVRQMQESSSDNDKTYLIDYDLTYKRKVK
ncbi:MAG: hypothetical protein H0U95_16315 [Bacteroidetes bacterium]|nr:hypothetical protein [Bacteroidota bacterium]